MSRKAKTFIWLAVALAALLLLAYRTPKHDFHQAIVQVDWFWAVIAVVLYAIAQTGLAPRWVLLLRAQGVNISIFQAVKLTYLGLFYNNMMPGAVGGDLLKGWYITHHSEKDRRLDAAVSVFVDRLVGLVGMIIVGAIASLFVGSDLKIPIAGYLVPVRNLIWLVLVVLVIAAVIFFSRRVRKVLLLSHLLGRLPFAGFLHKIDSSIQTYRRHIGAMLAALLMTAAIQGMAIVAIWMLTQSLGLERVRFVQCLIIIPIVWLVSAAVPVPGGLGVIENLFIPFFSAAINPSDPTAAIGQAAALALLNRLMLAASSMPGALVPLFGGHLPRVSEMEAALKDSQGE